MATSSVNTLGAATGMSAIIALVEWIGNSKMGLAMPPQVIVTVSAIIVTLAHWFANVANTSWALWVSEKEAGLPKEAVSMKLQAKQAGFVRLSMLLSLIVVAFAFLLSGCGTINSWTAAKTNIVEQDYKGAKANLERQDDDALQLWLDTSCDVKVGALKRSPNALTSVMEACPVSGLAKVSVANGKVSLAVPNSVQLEQSNPIIQTATAPAPAIDAETKLLMAQMLQAIQAIQSNMALKVVAPRVMTPAPRPKPPVSVQPQPIAPSPVQVAPHSGGIPVPTTPAPPIPAQKSFLSPVRTP